jgi:hypothetical protein
MIDGASEFKWYGVLELKFHLEFNGLDGAKINLKILDEFNSAFGRFCKKESGRYAGMMENNWRSMDGAVRDGCKTLLNNCKNYFNADHKKDSRAIVKGNQDYLKAILGQYHLELSTMWLQIYNLPKILAIYASDTTVYPILKAINNHFYNKFYNYRECSSIKYFPRSHQYPKMAYPDHLLHSASIPPPNGTF